MSYQYNNQQRQYSYAPPPPSYGGAPPPPPHLQQQQQWQYQQASSQQSRRQTAPPSAGVDPMLYHWFQAIDTDKSGTLTTEELQRALLNGDWSPFNMETVRLMMNLFDTDNDGTITFKEFTGLWKYIEDWKRCFQTFDADGSGTIDFNELKTALKTFGYNLSDSFIDLLIKKYDKYGNVHSLRWC
ncbi:89_t:CDS:2 [Paraglomus occultum]|uniref:89_t:CDS:1 n=1 Tax=Paraglomus occultum TaxID=144539 RepID=A0A9N8WAZ7_9GLOM|nr:89_t:CDS:2 [Paraglomus occultum]